MTESAQRDPRDDAELVAAINAGDVEAFEALYFRHRDWVYGLAVRFTGDDELALDVLQETFAYLLRKTPGLKLTARLRTFLYPAVKHIALALRRKSLRFASDEQALSELAAPPPAADHAGLEAALATLPEAQREVLVMRFVDDLALEEI
ncbi:MAG: sigma-70 family RNA polymerase sigma factor, partial [Planctomycetes bacterium]|nr:sigma-70 family RNA polymerase sigma factor [Planctomycetota bacterium]